VLDDVSKIGDECGDGHIWTTGGGRAFVIFGKKMWVDDWSESLKVVKRIAAIAPVFF